MRGLIGFEPWLYFCLLSTDKPEARLDPRLREDDEWENSCSGA